MKNHYSKDRYDIAFEKVVRQGYCAGCNIEFDSMSCHKQCCYDVVKQVRENIDRMRKSNPVYRGFTATVEYDEDDKLWHGVFDDAKNLVDFFAEKEEDVETEFHKAVDDYIAFMWEVQEKHMTYDKKTSMFDFEKDAHGKTCPLKYDAPTFRQQECSPDCAWYDESYGKCSILVLAQKNKFTLL